MRRTLSVLSTAAVACACISGCGINPFGPGESGLKLFAHLGKALSKPSVINDDQGSKEDAKTAVTRAQGYLSRYTENGGAGDPIDPPWLVAKGIADSGGGVFAYYEIVKNRPSDEDPDKIVTGRAEVKFRYDGDATLKPFDAKKVTAILSFEMIGREHKKWNLIVDSVRIKIVFADSDIIDFRPGSIVLWGKNITGIQSKGDGDTAAFRLDSLDDVNHIQYGEGHFLDAHTGRLHDGEPRAFDFTIQVIHKNTLDPGKPYLRYEDNEGIVKFYLPWTKTDSLHYAVHFYPHYRRTGEIRKNGPSGQLLVEFEYNEKTSSGEATYYNSKGEVVETETLGTGGV